VTELTDDEVMAPPQREMTDDEVMSPPKQQPASMGDYDPAALGGAGLVPDAFLQRVAEGEHFQRIAKKSAADMKEGFGEATPTGMSDETLAQLIQWGVFHDPLKSKPGPIQFVNEAMMLPGAQVWDRLVRSINAGLYGAGGFVGQSVEEATGSQGQGNRARNEIINAGNWAMIEGGFGRFSRPKVQDGLAHDQVIGGLPKPEDFTTGAAAIAKTADEAKVAEGELRAGWQERGVTPAEAVHDAQRDAFLKHDLTATEREPIAPIVERPAETRGLGVQYHGSSDPNLSPSSEHYSTKNYYGQGFYTTDAVDVAYGYTKRGSKETGARNLYQIEERGSLKIYDMEQPLDPGFLQKITPDGNRVSDLDHTLLTAIEDKPKNLRELYDNVRETGTGEGLSADVIQEIFDTINHNLREMGYAGASHLGGLKTKTAAHRVVIYFEPEQDISVTKIASGAADAKLHDLWRAEDVAALEETGGPLRPLSAAVSDPPDVPLSQQPASPPGRLMAAAHDAADNLFDMGRDLQMLVAPMATGTRDSMAIAKDFANAMRRNRWEWSRIDGEIEKKFTPEQRRRMWDAADEESVLRQEGQTSEHMGLATLTAEERAAVEEMHTRAQSAWLRARDLGMVEGEGLPAYTPRMVINVASAMSGDKPIPLNGIGRNLTVRTAQMMRRKYLTAEETEAAAKARLGNEAEIARDIRALPLAVGRLEDAIAGRKLIDAIKETGKRTGDDTLSVGGKPAGSEHEWFTVDHPAFRQWRPKFEEVDGKVQAVKDAEGNAIFEQVPIYVRGDFEGPLKAVLTQKSGAIYNAAMSLKGKTMGLIMNSPLIHNAVEWGRAIPAMPGKVATFKVYFEGNRAKNNVPLMREAIDAGLVPIGKRFFNQDITSIMEQPNLTPGRSWTAQVLGFVPGLFDEGAGTAVRAAIDKAGDFWHNTLLWDRVADLQMGLYTNMREGLVAKGVDGQTASRTAAHWANRYAGALPQEAMSDGARKIANMALFSRSFTMGNLGVMKDMLTGLPKDVLAQIERDAGFKPGAIASATEAAPGAAEAVQYAKSMARRKAMAIVAMDVGLMYIGNSLLQNAMNVLSMDSTLEKELNGYARRFQEKLTSIHEHPLELLQPFNFMESLSATADNEPGRKDRIKVGYAKDGTAIYARNPVGKIGEEFTGWLSGPLDMIRRKLGTIARPAWQIMSNDAGFGRKVYDPGADTPAKYLRNIGLIAQHIAGAQLPAGQLNAAADLVKGEGDPKVNALQALGPVAGVTFSKGAPGGPAVGELYHARQQHDFAVQAEMPDIRRQILRGDLAGAQERMSQLGIPLGLQRFYIRTSMMPQTRIGGRTLRDFYLYATPEQRQRFENAR
jgi:hypothetical protein